jgi:hypothetical protein
MILRDIAKPPIDSGILIIGPLTKINAARGGFGSTSTSDNRMKTDLRS